MLVAAICLVVSSFAAFTLETPPLKASEVFITIGRNGEKISLLDLSRMNVKDLQQLAGKKMKFFDKLALKELRSN